VDIRELPDLRVRSESILVFFFNEADLIFQQLVVREPSVICPYLSYLAARSICANFKKQQINSF
jgi:hypothetical protein